MKCKFAKKLKWARKKKLSKLTIVSKPYSFDCWGPYVDCIHNKTGKRFWWNATSSLNIKVIRPDGTAGVPADMATEYPKSPRISWN